VDEVNVHSVDGRLELREGVQFRLALAPVIIRRPMANECLKLSERRALRLIGDRLLVGPPGRCEAPAKIDELFLRDLHFERPDVIWHVRECRTHWEQAGRTSNGNPCRAGEQKAATIGIDGLERMGLVHDELSVLYLLDQLDCCSDLNVVCRRQFGHSPSCPLGGKIGNYCASNGTIRPWMQSLFS